MLHLPLIPASLAWLVMLAVAIANGAAREAWLTPRLGDTLARALSTLSGCALLATVALCFVLLRGRTTIPEAMWQTGVYWVVLVLAFEFLFGHYVAGHSWHYLLADYNLLQGRIWILVPLTVLLAPWVWLRLLQRTLWA